MKLCFFVASLVILCGCFPSQISLDKLQIEANQYCLKNGKPYTGKVISHFDNGNVASIIQMKDGVPNGRWIVYGYKREIIQEGNFHPVSTIPDDIFNNSNIVRLNVCNIKEGINEFTNVYIVANSTGNYNTGQYKRKLLSFLINKSITVKGDSINEIKCVAAELNH
ncbi:MAG TPA: hypothetical protein VIK74_11040 [Parasegetibacter sp.]|jgi:hypothetical protein